MTQFKRISSVLAASILLGSSAQAILGNLGRAIGDVYSFGQTGRDRDEAAAREAAEKARAARLLMEQDRNSKIQNFDKEINFATASRDKFKLLKRENEQLFEALKDAQKLLGDVITGQLKVKRSVKLTQNEVREISQDARIITSFIKDFGVPAKQKIAMQTLSEAAAARNLSVEVFVNRSVSLIIQTDQNTRVLYRQLGDNLTNYSVLLTQFDGVISEYDFEIKLASDGKKKITDAIAAEAAAESARAAAAAKAAQDEAKRQAEEARELRNSEKPFNRFTYSKSI